MHDAAGEENCMEHERWNTEVKDNCQIRQCFAKCHAMYLRLPSCGSIRYDLYRVTCSNCAAGDG